MRINKDTASEMNKSGIYAIVNLMDGKQTTYVGSTSNSFRARMRGHVSCLNLGRSKNPHLQRAWNKYGEDAFEFSVLEVVERKEKLLEHEQFWLDQLKKKRATYNCEGTVERPTLGKKLTDEQKRKIGERQRGRRASLETKRKMREAALGKPKPKSTSELLRAWHSKAYPSFRNVYTGEVIPPGINLKQLCCTKRISKIGLREVRDGKKLQHRGWVLADNSPSLESVEADERERRKRGPHSETHSKNLSLSHQLPYPSFINKKSGEVIPAGIGLSQMCRSKGLHYASMHKVARGKSKCHRGWIVLQGKNSELEQRKA